MSNFVLVITVFLAACAIDLGITLFGPKLRIIMLKFVIRRQVRAIKKLIKKKSELNK